MSSTYTASFDRLDEGLDEIAAIDPSYRSTGEKQHALVALSRFIARAEAERMRILAVADDIAETTGDRSVAAWLATQTRDAPGTVRRTATLAAALDKRWVQLAAALAAGTLNLAQTRVIADALEALPKDLGDDLLVKAEAFLVEKAAKLGPRELRFLGGRVLEHLAPDIADDIEYRRLLAEEKRSHAATRLYFKRRGDGSTDIHARVPDHVGNRLRVYLDAYTAPRRNHLTPDIGDVDERPLARRHGEAFCAMLENLPDDGLPRHGGTATSVMVILDYDTLLAQVGQPGIATTTAGDVMTAEQARRLACQARIIPVVLNGKGEILDVARMKRLVTDAIRKALNLRDKGCTTLGCTIPAAWCEAHHKTPWSMGGKTSLADCILLCPFHHHRAHDPGWITHHHPNGETSFTRRQ